MIKYIEKGSGLHAAIQIAGEWAREENGKWIVSNEVAVQSIIDAYTVLDAANFITPRMDAYAAALRKKATAGISAAEMASWSTKADEAKAYTLSNNTADAPNLAIEAAVRGVPLDNIISRVLKGAASLMALECEIAGIKGKHSDALRACQTFEEVIAYDWSVGWPEIG